MSEITLTIPNWFLYLASFAMAMHLANMALNVWRWNLLRRLKQYALVRNAFKNEPKDEQL